MVFGGLFGVRKVRYVPSFFKVPPSERRGKQGGIWCRMKMKMWWSIKRKFNEINQFLKQVFNKKLCEVHTVFACRDGKIVKLSTVKADMVLALQKHVAACFNDLNKIIISTSVKDLHSMVPQMIESIFNFSGNLLDHANFGLVFSHQHIDFDICTKFFSLESVFISTLMQMTNDHNLSLNCPFKISCLPTSVQQELMSGKIPDILKLRSRPLLFSQSGDAILLDPFEFFLFHFSYFLSNPTNWKVGQAFKLNGSKCQWSYSSIFLEYLDVFLSTKSNFIPPKISPHLGTSEAPLNTSVEIHHNTSFSPQQQHDFKHTAPHPSIDPSTTLKYFNRALLQPPSSTSISKLIRLDDQALSIIKHTPPTKHHLNPLHHRPIFYSQLFISIISSFWLDLPSIHLPFSTKSCRSEEQYHLLRVMVKKLHHFCNSVHLPKPHSDLSPRDAPLWNNFKKNVWNANLREKLFSFIKYHLEGRMMDRPVLEVWLTYIQPWKYGLNDEVDGMVGDGVSREGDEVGVDKKVPDKKRYLGEKWVTFVYDNLPFYTTFLISFLHSHVHIDLSYHHHLHLLHHVFQVFSIKPLNLLIKSHEQSQQDDSINTNQPHHSPYKHLFSAEVHRDVSTIICNAIEARSKTQQQQMILTGDKFHEGLLNRSYDWLMGSRGGDTEELSHINLKLRLLDSLINNLFDFFKISYADLDASHVRQQTYTQPQPPNHIPDCEFDEDGFVRLTNQGRHEIINNKKVFDLSYQGDPDFQPIRSFENASLVRFLTSLSQDLSHVYSENLSEAVKQKGASGLISRTLFLPSAPTNCQSHFVKLHSTGNGPIGYRSITSRRNVNWWTQPRFRLRFLAAYSTWLMLVLLVGCVKGFLGCSLSSAILLFFVFMLTLVVVVMRMVVRVGEKGQ